MLATSMRTSAALLSLLTTLALTPITHAAEPLATIPFVGCPADGQLGPEPAPHGQPRHLAIPQGASERLAWYEFDGDAGQIGILAPRRWNCFATIGSDGLVLYVSPEHLAAAKVLEHKHWRGFNGPAIQLSAMEGGTSGRFDVAQVAARVFPHFHWFVKKVIAEDIEPASDFHFGPFPADKLTYRSNHLVEFTTPGNSVGLGTQSWLLKGPGDISGFAWIGGEDTNLLQLNMRLPPALARLGPIIIQQAEGELAATNPH